MDVVIGLEGCCSSEMSKGIVFRKMKRMVGCSKDGNRKVMRDVVESDGSRLAWILKILRCWI